MYYDFKPTPLNYDFENLKLRSSRARNTNDM